MTFSIETHEFRLPIRNVRDPSDITKWEKSEAYQDIMGFLMSMNQSVRGKGCSAACTISPTTERLLAMIDKLSAWVDEIPPVDQPQRYGNKAFRDYYLRLMKEGTSLVEEVIGPDLKIAAEEVSIYLVESVGNSTRIDYGTGHEFAFIMFLTCLYKIHALKQEDSIATVNKVFKRYLDLVRKLQLTYKMEPAGSQGVWSLDDYQFVPFIWGSSQLQMNPKISPEMFISPKVVEDNAEEYLFLSCIKFIQQVKTGPFAEHSNQLWNISGVQTWTKINQGLIKMYKAEVLHKFPVMQHVLFGSVLSIVPAKSINFPPPSGILSHGSTGSMMPRPMGGLSDPIMGTMPSRPISGRPNRPMGVMPPKLISGRPDIPMGVMPPRAMSGRPELPMGTMPPRPMSGRPELPMGTMPPRPMSGRPDIPMGVMPSQSMSERPELSSGLSESILPVATTVIHQPNNEMSPTDDSQKNSGDSA